MKKSCHPLQKKIKSSIEAIRRLIENGVNLQGEFSRDEYFEDDRTQYPISAAISSNRNDVFDLLLEMDVDANSPQSKGDYNTTIGHAACSADYHCYFLLLDNGVDIFPTCTSTNFNISPLHVVVSAAADDESDGVDEEDDDDFKRRISTLLQRMPDDGIDTLCFYHHGNAWPNIPKSPLHIACEAGSANVIRYLLECGATADTLALCLICFYDKLDVVEQLIANGAQPEFHNRKIKQPIHVAAEHGFVEIVDFLISKGVDINVRDDRYNYSAIGWAKFKDYRCGDVVELLESHGAR